MQSNIWEMVSGKWCLNNVDECESARFRRLTGQLGR